MDFIFNGNSPCIPTPPANISTQGDWFSNFLVSIGYPQNQLPLGDFLRQYHQLQGNWLVMTPVYWEATHNDAMIMAAGRELLLNEQDSHALFIDVNRFLSEVGLSLYYHDATTWLLHAPEKPPLKSKSAFLMQKQSMMPAFDEMDTQMYWPGLLTELQMFLSQHPLNTKRVNQLPVNGVWVHGAGVFTFPRAQQIMTNDEALLARFPCHFQSLRYDNTVKNNAVFMIDSAQENTLARLKVFADKYHTRWFWNNTARLCEKKTWWRTLWRGMVNACQTKGTP